MSLELQTLREQIKTIDTAIIEHLAERDALIQQVGAFKHAQNKAITDHEQEAKQYAYYKQLCEQHHISYEFVKKLFELMIAHAKQQQ